MTWGWVINYRIFISMWTIPLKTVSDQKYQQMVSKWSLFASVYFQYVWKVFKLMTLFSQSVVYPVICGFSLSEWHFSFCEGLTLKQRSTWCVASQRLLGHQLLCSVIIGPEVGGALWSWHRLWRKLHLRTTISNSCTICRWGQAKLFVKKNTN